MEDRNQEDQKTGKSFDDEDLVIEENTIYEVDLDCYECLKKERKVPK